MLRDLYGSGIVDGIGVVVGITLPEVETFSLPPSLVQGTQVATVKAVVTMLV